MRLTHPLPSLLLLLAAGTSLVAQTSQGSLQGRIRTPEGQPVSGAEIQLTSKALLQPRSARSAADGNWRAPLLPPGTYTLTVRKAGFNTVVRTFTLGLNDTARVDFRLAPEQSAIVEVKASAEAAAKSEIGQSANFSAERLQALPTVDRAFRGAAELSPGVVAGRSGEGFVIRGGKEYNTGYTVDGVNVKDPIEGRTGAATFFVEDAIQEVKVNLSPVHPRHGGTDGGTINAVTKSGSNEFEGSLRLQIARDAWRAVATNMAQAPSDDLNRELTYTVGGPMVKDRLWFFASGKSIPSDTDTNAITPWTGQMANKTPDQWTVWDPGTKDPGAAALAGLLKAGPGAGYAITPFDSGYPYGQSYNLTTRKQYFQGKVKGALSADHLVEVTFSRDRQTYTHRFSSAFARLAQLDMDGDQQVKASTLGLTYTGILSATTFLDVNWNLYSTRIHHAQGDTSYSDPLAQGFGNASTSNYGALYPFRMPQFNEDRREIRSASANLKHFLQAAGSHELDLGLQYQDLGRATNSQMGPNGRTFYIGSAAMVNPAGQYLWAVINRPLAGATATGTWQTAYNQQNQMGLTPYMTQQLGKDGYNHNKRTSLYLSDTWTPNAQWVVMGGLRWDRFQVMDTDGSSRVTSSLLSPRASLKWDVLGNQAHVLQLTFARYAADFGGAFSRQFIQSASSATLSRLWTGNAKGGGLLPGQMATLSGSNWVVPGTYQNPGDATDSLYGLRWVSYAQLTNPDYYGLPVSFTSLLKSMNVDPGLKPEYTNEVTVGYVRNFESGASLTLTGVFKRWHNQWAFETSADLDHLTQVNPADYGASLLAPFWGQVTNVFNTEALRREYKALEMTWRGAPIGRFSWGGNYTYSQLKGNDQGGDVSGPGTAMLASYSPQAYYLQRNLLLSRGLTDNDFAPFGLLANNSQHRARLTFDFLQPLANGRLTYGFIVQYNAGMPLSLRCSAPNGLKAPTVGPDGNRVLNTAAGTTYFQYYGGQGTWQAWDTYSTSFKASFEVPLGYKRVVVFGDFILTNLFNTPVPTNNPQDPVGNFVFGGTWTVGGLTQPAAFYAQSIGNPTMYTGARQVGSVSLGLRF